MKKIYHVIIQDEWNNLFHCGFYNELSEAIPDINNFLEAYNVQIDELTEYPSTFDICFDREIEIEEGIVMIRGFIFNSEYLKEVLMYE